MSCCAADRAGQQIPEGDTALQLPGGAGSGRRSRSRTARTPGAVNFGLIPCPTYHGLALLPLSDIPHWILEPGPVFSIVL